MDGVYSLNYVRAYVSGMPRKRFVSKNEVRNKFIEGYNSLKNAMDMINGKRRDPVFDRLPPLCIRMSTMRAVDDLADEIPIWTSTPQYKSPHY